MAKLRAKEIKDKFKIRQNQRQQYLVATGQQSKIKTEPRPEGSLPDIHARGSEAVAQRREKKKNEHWLNLLDQEHADAVISDAFWYVICKLCNPKPEFELH